MASLKEELDIYCFYYHGGMWWKSKELYPIAYPGEKCRFNVGGWEERHIEASEELDGIEFYRKKDKVMIEECDCGFFVWDAHSIGTKLNRMDLKRLGKPIFT